MKTEDGGWHWTSVPMLGPLSSRTDYPLSATAAVFSSSRDGFLVNAYSRTNAHGGPNMDSGVAVDAPRCGNGHGLVLQCADRRLGGLVLVEAQPNHYRKYPRWRPSLTAVQGKTAHRNAGGTRAGWMYGDAEPNANEHPAVVHCRWWDNVVGTATVTCPASCLMRGMNCVGVVAVHTRDSADACNAEIGCCLSPGYAGAIDGYAHPQENLRGDSALAH